MGACGRLFFLLAVFVFSCAAEADADITIPMNTNTMRCIDKESAGALVKLKGEYWDEKITEAAYDEARILLKLKCKYYYGEVPFAELVPLAVYDTTDSSKMFFAAENDEQVLIYEGMKVKKGKILDVCDTVENGKTALEARLSSLEQDKVKTLKVYTSKHCRAGTATKNLIIFPTFSMSRDVYLPVGKNGMHSSVTNSFDFGQMLEKGQVVHVVTGRQSN